MKRSTVLIGIGIIILGISVLGGLSLIDSESIEKTKKINSNNRTRIPETRKKCI